MAEPTNNDRARTAEEVCADIELGQDAQALLTPEQRPRQYMNLLIEHKHYSDGIRFLARALPRHLAVRWGLDCVGPEFDNKSEPGDRACLEAAEKWLDDRSDEHRAQALKAAEEGGFSGPCALVAAAAGWSGGSLSTGGLDPVPPAASLTARAIAGALELLASEEPERIEERQLAMLRSGSALARDAEPGAGEGHV